MHGMPGLPACISAGALASTEYMPAYWQGDCLRAMHEVLSAGPHASRVPTKCLATPSLHYCILFASCGAQQARGTGTQRERLTRRRRRPMRTAGPQVRRMTRNRPTLRAAIQKTTGHQATKTRRRRTMRRIKRGSSGRRRQSSAGAQLATLHCACMPGHGVVGARAVFLQPGTICWGRPACRPG